MGGLSYTIEPEWKFFYMFIYLNWAFFCFAVRYRPSEPYLAANFGFSVYFFTHVRTQFPIFLRETTSGYHISYDVELTIPEPVFTEKFFFFCTFSWWFLSVIKGNHVTHWAEMVIYGSNSHIFFYQGLNYEWKNRDLIEQCVVKIP